MKKYLIFVILLFAFSLSGSVFASNLLGVVTSDANGLHTDYGGEEYDALFHLVSRFRYIAAQETGPGGDYSGWGYYVRGESGDITVQRIDSNNNNSRKAWANPSRNDDPEPGVPFEIGGMARYYDHTADDDYFFETDYDELDGITFMIAHSRRSTIENEYQYIEGHPFVYEYGDSEYAFAHNGQLGDEEEDWWTPVNLLIGAYWDGEDLFSEENCQFRGTETGDAIDSQLFSMLLMKNIIDLRNWKLAGDWVADGLFDAALGMTMWSLVSDGEEDGTGAIQNLDWTSLNFLFSIDGNTLYAVNECYDDEDDDHKLRVVHHEADGYETDAWAVISSDGPHGLGNLGWSNLIPAEILDHRYAKFSRGLENGYRGWDMIDHLWGQDQGLLEVYNAVGLDSDALTPVNPRVGDGPSGEFAIICEDDGAIIGNTLNVMGIWEYANFGITSDTGKYYSDPDVAFDLREGGSLTNDFYVSYTMMSNSDTKARDVQLVKYEYDSDSLDWYKSSTVLTLSDAAVTTKEVENTSLSLDDDGNIAVVWQQKLPGTYDWEIRCKIVSTSMSVVENEFSCGESGTIQTKPDVAWIGTEDDTSSFIIAYRSDAGQDGIYMRRLRPDGKTLLSSSYPICTDSTNRQPSKPSLAKSGDYFVCAYRYDATTGANPYKAESRHYTSPLDFAFPGSWPAPDEAASSGTYTYMDEQVATAGRPGDLYDLAYVAGSAITERNVFAAEGTVGSKSLSVENWGIDTTDSYATPALAIAPDFLVASPDENDENRRLIVWYAEADTGDFDYDIKGRFDPPHFPNISLSKRAPGVLDSESDQPQDYVLVNVYPNPFNSVTTIKFDLGKAGQADVSIFNIQGRQVTTLQHGYRAKGSYKINFDASEYASGLYFLRVEAAGEVKTKKLLFLK
ncbi:MAG: T9SS type A sorting domain-containing protein [Candidatus Electryonea clarkiae]|nr:T9SS type A sorting domain-containing protein [Candidatus Electryonea clarkiae]MDP8287988.1 T9SS type A sorting domain-containing protein [Candidatus Electryonea clarkiae]